MYLKRDFMKQDLLNLCILVRYQQLLERLNIFQKVNFVIKNSQSYCKLLATWLLTSQGIKCSKLTDKNYEIH